MTRRATCRECGRRITPDERHGWVHAFTLSRWCYPPGSMLTGQAAP